jgi:hypothetical protein
MNYYYIQKPLHYDGGSYYTEQDRDIINQICNSNK